jgi:hypothetical protein
VIEILKSILAKFLKFTSPLFLVLIPATAIYGFIEPWKPMEHEISKHPDSIAVMSGFTAKYSGDYERLSRSYLLINPSKLESKTISLSIDSKGLRDLRIEEGGLLPAIIYYSFFAFCTYWFWFKNTHNKSRQQDVSNADTAA